MCFFISCCERLLHHCNARVCIRLFLIILEFSFDVTIASASDQKRYQCGCHVYFGGASCVWPVSVLKGARINKRGGVPLPTRSIHPGSG